MVVDAKVIPKFEYSNLLGQNFAQQFSKRT